jgi:hypothetical protein
VVLSPGTGAGARLGSFEVPPPGRPWPSGESVPVPPGGLVASPASDARCGVSGEEMFAFAARQGESGLFVAAGDPRLFAFRFAAPLASDLVPVCGRCPPSVLLRAEDQTTLMVPVGNRLTPLDVRSPLAVTRPRAAKRSVATCSADVILVAHLAEGRVYAQVTRPGVWQFARPRLLAAPSEHGEPVDVRVAVGGGRLFVLWRRSERMRLRLEMLASDDGGLTWR